MSQLSSKARRIVELSRSADDPVAADQRRVRLALGRRLGAGATATIVGVGTAKVAAGATAVAGIGKGIALVSVSVALAVALGQPGILNHEDASHRALVSSHNPAVNAAGKSRLAHGVDRVENAALPGPIESDVNRVENTAASSPHDVAQGTAVRNPTERETAGAASPSAETANAGSAPYSRSRSAQPSGDSAGTSRAGQPAIARFDSLSDSVLAPPDRSAQTQRTASAPSAAVLVAKGTPRSVVDPLQAETAALREAQRAMRSSDPARALSLVNAQDVVYASGALAQERAAARVYALCALGSLAQARSQAQDFAQRWPRSPMLGRVRAACSAP